MRLINKIYKNQNYNKNIVSLRTLSFKFYKRLKGKQNNSKSKTKKR